MTTLAPSYYDGDTDQSFTFIGSGFGSDASSGVSEKLMLNVVVSLVSMVAFFMFVHICARWYNLRTRRQGLVRSRNRFVFRREDDSRNLEQQQGLDRTILNSLPVFEFSVETFKCPRDCAVCLSEFADGESGRTLPRCKHSFHTECIDMWFHSHSTCPLCRTLVQLPKNPTTTSRSGSGSGPEPVSESEQGSSSSGSSVKTSRSLTISVEVPGNSFRRESTPAQSTPPVGRIISRILSRERKPCTPPATLSSGGCAEEIDLECGQQDTATEQR